MTPLLVQTIALLILLFAMMLVLLTGYLLWLQRRSAAEQDRQHETRRHWLATRQPGRYPPSYRPPRR